MKPICIVFLILTLGACSQKEQALTMTHKAQLMTELITDNAQCRSFSLKLKVPAINDATIEKIYTDAMKARCINKDV